MTQIATVLFILLIVGLFALDYDPKLRTSKGLWLAVVWLLISASRPVSQWLSLFGVAGASIHVDAPEQYLDGSPVDRFSYICLLAVGLTIAISRRKRVARFLKGNTAILLFLGYCALSVLWSDYTFVAFKRWTKIVGDLLIVLIVLSDLEPVSALRRLLTRAGFIIVPLSVLFIKYYPEIGREYNIWTWIPAYSGAAETKNELGMLCLVFGLGSVWRVLELYSDKNDRRRARKMITHGLIVAMVLWLFYMSNSMTSMACFALASGLMAVTLLFRIGRRPAVVHVLLASLVIVAGAVLFSGGGGGVLSTLGRDPSLTGRTGIWDAVISVSGNPLIGTGFESFWLGERLQKVWAMTMKGLQEAHNGYLEVYLNLGWIGLGLLSALVVTGYRNIISGMRRDPGTGSLKLAFFAVAIVYNFTEAGFRETTLIWIFFLIAIAYVPAQTRKSPTKSIDYKLESDEILSMIGHRENV
jgi:exopolysaccharide production protein ExoQ